MISRNRISIDVCFPVALVAVGLGERQLSTLDMVRLRSELADNCSTGPLNCSVTTDAVDADDAVYMQGRICKDMGIVCRRSQDGGMAPCTNTKAWKVGC